MLDVSAQKLLGGIHIKDILDRVHSAVKKLQRDAYKEFVFDLRDARKSRGVSQKEMPKRLNVSQGVVSQFESAAGQERTLDFFISYVNALDSLDAKPPAPIIDKYSEFVSVLRSIRESYQVTQEEMAALMGADQDTISKFESAKLNVKLDFLIFYASLLGYNIKVGSTFRSRGERSRFRRRQSRITQALRYVHRWQIENLFYSGVYWYARWPGKVVEESRERIISDLRDAKKTEGLTTKKLSEELGISDRTIRRFERAENCTSSASFAFKYASLVNVNLRLEKNLRCKRETLGAFYLRRGMVIYNWIREKPWGMMPTITPLD